MALPDIKYFLGIGENPTEPKIHLSQYDTGNTFRVFLVSHGHFVEIDSDVTAVIVGKKPDGNGYTYNCEITDSRTAVIVTVTEEMTAIAGDTVAEIILTCANGNRAGTANFIIAVEESPIDGATVSNADYVAIYQAISAATTATEAAERAETAAAAAEAAQAAIEAGQPEVVTITIPEAKLWSAIAAAQAAASRSAALDLTGATYDPADAARIRAAYLAGKRVRFDLTMTTGERRGTFASAESMHTNSAARNYYTFKAAFDFAALGATSNINGLETLGITYTYDGGTNPATYGVSATAYAAGGYYDAENQLYVL